MSTTRRLLLAPVVIAFLFAQAMRDFMQESVAYLLDRRSL